MQAQPMQDRQIFYLDDDPSKPVTAGGVMIYRNYNNTLQCLMEKVDNIYSDIGGKTEISDKSIFETICREVEEETNGLISGKDLMDRLRRSKKIYINNCKYCMCLIEADEKESRLQMKDFGDIEKQNNLQRKIGWMSLRDFSQQHIIRYKLNWRLRCKILFTYLYGIEHELKFRKKLFTTVSNK